MVSVDIPADLNSEDETEFAWTFLDEADDPSIIRPGEVVVAGSALMPAVCEVVDLVDKPDGTVIHLRACSPGTIEQFRRLLDRVGRSEHVWHQPSGLHRGPRRRRDSTKSSISDRTNRAQRPMRIRVS